MTIDNWLMIAVIISTLIAPTLANFIQFRASHPKPTPEVNQPKNLTQRIGGWLIRFFQSPGKVAVFVVLPTILFNIYLLRGDLRNPAPVTRRVVFQICLGVGGIVYNLLSLGMLFIWQAIGRQADIIRTQTKTISELIDIVKISNELTEAQINDLREQIKALVPTQPAQIPPDKPAQGTLRKLLAGIKNLFGD
jgi:hypothetical protein